MMADGESQARERRRSSEAAQEREGKQTSTKAEKRKHSMVTQRKITGMRAPTRELGQATT